MLRSSRRTPLYAVALAVVVTAAFASPALAHKGGRDHGGKKAVGEVVSFDGTTLTVSMVDGSTVAAPVAEDVKIKVEHRGKKAHGKGYKKPSNGSLGDLTAGAKVLKLKLECNEVAKLRLRRAAASTTEVSATTETGTPEVGGGEVAGPGSEDAAQLPETTETEDADDDACDPEDEADDDAGDAPELGTEAGDDAADDVAEELETDDGSNADDGADEDSADDGSDDDGSDGLLDDVTEVVGELPTL